MSLWWLSLLLLAGTPVSLDRSVMAVPGRVLSVAAADIGGDGSNEILVFWRDGYPFDSVFRLSVFSVGDRGTAAKPVQVLALPHATVGFEVGEADGDGRADVLLLNASGVSVLRGGTDGRLSEEPADLVRSMTVAAFPHDDRVPPLRLLVPLGTGRTGLLIPTVPIGPLSLFERGADGRFALRQVLRVPTRSRVDSAAEDTRSLRDAGLVFDFVFPRWQLSDLDGDGRADLFFFSQDGLAVFRQRADGSYPGEPDLWRNFGLLQPKERVKTGVFVRGEAGDVNGDGRADIAFSRTSGGVSNMRAELRLYQTRASGEIPRAPEFTRAFDGYGAGAHLEDVDGDRHADLVQPHLEMGMSQLVQMMLVSRVDVAFELHLSKGGKLPEHPDGEVRSSFGIDFRSNQEITGTVPVFGTDFSGDGRPDVVVGVSGGGSGSEPDRLEIREGEGKARFGEVLWRVDLSATRYVVPFYPRRGGKPGLLVYFTQVEGKMGDVWVFIPPT